MISVKIIADSTSWLHKRLTTYILEYPRYIHSELMTHRVFSKNSASSRAIPFHRFVEMVDKKPVMPVWTRNQAGMQGSIIEDKGEVMSIDRIWIDAKDDMIKHASKIHNEYGVHKQNVNRLLEPWMHIRIVLTGTEFDNWFELRDHAAAHPEIQRLAKLMRAAYNDSTPKFLREGEWHIPFGDDIPGLEHVLEGTIIKGGGDTYKVGKIHSQLKCSVARCARVSYDNFDGTKSLEKDIDLYNKLVVSEPLHASPAEHQARVPSRWEMRDLTVNWYEDKDESDEQATLVERRGKYFSNLVGWIQLRKLIECEEFK